MPSTGGARSSPELRAGRVKPLVLALLVVVGGTLAGGLVLLSRFSTLEPRGATFDPARAAEWTRFDYQDWKAVLEEHVDAEGRVDYANLVRERMALDRFTGLLAVLGPETRPELFPTTDDRLAYYLNAYNALVLINVLERYPSASVNESKVDFFYFTRFRLDGRKWNLYDLENGFIRPTFREPRVHFALNCASVSCPRLPREVFEGPRLQEQLQREAERFLHEPRNVSVEDGTLVLSAVFDWFEEDFPPDPRAWIDEAAPDLELPRDAPIRHRPWDWSLNDR